MPPTPSQPPAEGFWRCPRCGTPNPRASYLTSCIGCGAPRPAASASTIEAPPASTKSSTSPARRGRAVAIASWAFAATVLLALIVMRTLGDRWLPATLLLFSPRFAWLLPLVPLAILAWRARRRALLALHAATALIILGPFMGLSLPVASLWRAVPEGTTLRILTLNRHADAFDDEALARLIASERVDVICFQEFFGNIPTLDPFLAWGWHRSATGYIYSRYPIVAELEPPSDTFAEFGLWAAKCFRVRIALPTGQEAVIASLHLPSPRAGFQTPAQGGGGRLGRSTSWRWMQVGATAELLAGSRDVPLIAAGDLNMASDSPLMGLLRRDFRIAFREAGWGYGYTRPSAIPWVGIDHILTSPEWVVRRCRIGPDVGSDHRPVLAEVVLPRGSAVAPDVAGR